MRLDVVLYEVSRCSLSTIVSDNCQVIILIICKSCVGVFFAVIADKAAPLGYEGVFGEMSGISERRRGSWAVTGHLECLGYWEKICPGY